MKIDLKFYPAYAYHRWCTPKDIINVEPFDTYKEAKDYANTFLCDDDCTAVYVKIDDVYYEIMKAQYEED